jgi:large subunit ribosomal protein L21
MFAVIKTGGKQYRVAANDLLTVGKVAGSPGDIVTFPVMLLGGDKPSIGAPLVAGATVAAEVVEHQRGAKVIAFKKRRRQNSRRKRGHRQDYTVVRVTEILTDGQTPSKTAPKREPKPKAEAKPAEAGAEEKPKAKTPAKKPAAKAKGKSKK